MSVTAYDSASPQNIPEDAQAIFPYGDGLYAWSHDLRPNAAYRYITVVGDPAKDICDYEAGCVFSTAVLLDWATDRRKVGLDVTVYCDRSNYPTVAETLKGLNWHLWLSTLDGTKPRSYRGKVLRAVQYTDRSNLYDISEVYDAGWLIAA